MKVSKTSALQIGVGEAFKFQENPQEVQCEITVSFLRYTRWRLIRTLSLLG